MNELVPVFNSLASDENRERRSRRLLRKLLILATALAAGCGGAELRYAPVRPTFALASERLAPVASVRFVDASGGMQSMGTALMLKRRFFDSFHGAMSDSLTALGVSTSTASGADVEIALTESRLDRGQGLNADLTATVRYALRVRRGGRVVCEREGSGWAVLRESLVASPDAKTVEQALARAADGLGPVLASSCLYASGTSGTAVSASSAAASSSAANEDVDVPPSPGRRDPRLLVLSIGVERYRGFAPARFAANDARAFAAYAQSVLGAAPERVALAVDEDATDAGLRKYLEGWLPNRVGVGDTVVVYFAGRGAFDSGAAKTYLLPSDGDAAYLEQTAYPLPRLLEQLGRLPAKVVVVLDGGFSGSGPRSSAPPGSRGGVAASIPLPPPNVILIDAAGPAQSVGFDAAHSHGLFTYFLLKSLRDAPDLGGAFDAAAPQVRKAATEQSPQRRPL
jgi:hypothetical protein